MIIIFYNSNKFIFPLGGSPRPARRRRSALSAIKQMRSPRSEKVNALSQYTNLYVEAKRNDVELIAQNTCDEATDGSTQHPTASVSMRSSTSDVESNHRHQLCTDATQATMSSRLDGEDEQLIVKSESFRVHHSNHQASQGIRFSFMRTYSHSQQSENNRRAAASNSSSSRAGSFGSSAFVKPQRRTKTVLYDEDFVVGKTRRISTPDLINRRHLLRQKSMESLEQLRTLRESIHMRNERADSLSHQPPVTSNDDVKTTPAINNIRPARKLSNFFRKISLSTSKSLKLNANPDAVATRNHNNNNNKNLNEQDIIVVERDRALEEWSESAKKCEELIDELDITLSELVTVSKNFIFSFA